MLPSALYVGRLTKDAIGWVDMSQPNQGRYETPHANFDMSLKPGRTSRAAAVSVYGLEHIGSPKMISTIVSKVKSRYLQMQCPCGRIAAITSKGRWACTLDFAEEKNQQKS